MEKNKVNTITNTTVNEGISTGMATREFQLDSTTGKGKFMKVSIWHTNINNPEIKNN